MPITWTAQIQQQQTKRENYGFLWHLSLVSQLLRREVKRWPLASVVAGSVDLTDRGAVKEQLVFHRPRLHYADVVLFKVRKFARVASLFQLTKGSADGLREGPYFRFGQELFITVPLTFDKRIKTLALQQNKATIPILVVAVHHWANVLSTLQVAVGPKVREEQITGCGRVEWRKYFESTFE